MIGKNELAEAARNADAVAEEIGLPAWCVREGIDLAGLAYVANQRALRAAYFGIDGHAKDNALSGPIELSAAAQAMMPLLAASVMDGIAIGRSATKREVKA